MCDRQAKRGLPTPSSWRAETPPSGVRLNKDRSTSPFAKGVERKELAIFRLIPDADMEF